MIRMIIVSDFASKCISINQIPPLIFVYIEHKRTCMRHCNMITDGEAKSHVNSKNCRCVEFKRFRS